MNLAALVSTDLIHPNVDDYYIGHSEAKQCNLPLDYPLALVPLNGVESLGVDDVKLAIVLQPHSFGTSLPALKGVEDGEVSLECGVEEGAFAWALGAEDGEISNAVGVLVEEFAGLGVRYLNLPCSSMRLIIGLLLWRV